MPEEYVVEDAPLGEIIPPQRGVAPLGLGEIPEGAGVEGEGGDLLDEQARIMREAAMRAGQLAAAEPMLTASGVRDPLHEDLFAEFAGLSLEEQAAAPNVYNAPDLEVHGAAPDPLAAFFGRAADGGMDGTGRRLRWMAVRTLLTMHEAAARAMQEGGPDAVRRLLYNVDDAPAGAARIQGPAQRRLGGPQAAGQANGGLPVPVGAPPRGGALQARGNGALAVPGGDLGRGQRAMGSMIFQAMPCFTRHTDLSVQQGRDPLGEVQVLANIGGMGPSDQAELDTMARAIRENGVMVDAAEVEFPMVMPGYRPRIILAADIENSYLMVEETTERGGLVNATYIYAWQGGRGFYDNPEARTALAGLHAQANAPRPAPAPAQAAIAAPAFGRVPAARAWRPPPGHVAPVRRIEAPVTEAPVAQAAIPARQPGPAAVVVAARPVVRAAEPTAPRVDPRPPTIKAVTQASVAPGRATSTLASFRASGFIPVGTASGPALYRDLPGGGRLLVRAQDGASLPRATLFSAAIEDPDGAETSTLRDVDGPVAALEWATVESAPRGPGMR